MSSFLLRAQRQSWPFLSLCHLDSLSFGEVPPACIELTPFMHLLTPYWGHFQPPPPVSPDMDLNSFLYAPFKKKPTNFGLTPKTKRGWAHKVSVGSNIFKGRKRKGFIYCRKTHVKAHIYIYFFHSQKPLKPFPPSELLPPGTLFS